MRGASNSGQPLLHSLRVLNVDSVAFPQIGPVSARAALGISPSLLPVRRAHDPTHGCHPIGAEAEDLPHFLGGGDRVADDVGAHTSIIEFILGGREAAEPLMFSPLISTSGGLSRKEESPSVLLLKAGEGRDNNPCAGFRSGWFPRSRNWAQGLLSPGFPPRNWAQGLLSPPPPCNSYPSRTPGLFSDCSPRLHLSRMTFWCLQAFPAGLLSFPSPPRPAHPTS